MKVSTAAIGRAPGARRVCRCSAAAAAQAPRALNLSREERAAIAALQAAAAGPDRAAQDSALAAARAAARGADARYAVAHYQSRSAAPRGDAADAGARRSSAGRERPRHAAPSCRRCSPTRRPRLFRRRPDAHRPAARADDRAAAQQSGGARRSRPVQGADPAAATGRRPDRRRRLVPARARRQRGTGRPAPESWYLRALALAMIDPAAGRRAALAPQTIAFARGLVAALSEPAQLARRAARLSRARAAPIRRSTLDIRRLMRASRGAGRRARLSRISPRRSTGRLVGEAKAVLDEGVSRGMLDAAKPAVAAADRHGRPRAPPRTAPALPRLRTQRSAAATGAAARAAGDAHFGYGQYAEAAELYRAALQKGGEDPNLVNTRLGAALALGRPAARGRGGASRGHRPARRACRLLAGLAGAAAGLTGFRIDRRRCR